MEINFFEDFESSNIKGIAYDDGTLYVKFHKDTVYVYSGVTRQRYDAFKNSESKGQYFHKKIRSNYEYKKL